MANIYYTSELSIDVEMGFVVLFHPYIKGKYHLYGVKLYSVNKPQGLIVSLLVYVGADDNLSGKSHSLRVVLNPKEGMLNCGHSLWMKNVYDSFNLATKLFKKTYWFETLRET